MADQIANTDYQIAEDYTNFRDEILLLTDNFEKIGETIFHQRNTIKKLSIGDTDIAMKSFRQPRGLQALVYGMLRKSKARRSFEHARKLQALGVNTPAPVAYIENKTSGRLQNSYYLCRFEESSGNMADVLQPFDASDRSIEILKAFTQFTFEMHEKNVLHIDHNTGNTLIRSTTEGIDFSIIDINRMQFKSLSIRQRLNNFVRLTDDIQALNLIADTYAECSGQPVTYCRNLLLTLKKKHLRKLALKQKMKSAFRKNRVRK